MRVPTSPPRERRDDVANICRKHGGRLCERQIFYDDVEGSAFALIEWPNREEAAQALLEELGAFDHVGLVDADEQAEQGEAAAT